MRPSFVPRSAQRLGVFAAAILVLAALPALADDAPPNVRVGPGGLGVTSADGEWGLNLTGWTQSVGRIYANDVDERGTSGFAVRRLRTDLRVTAGEIVSGRMHLAFEGGRASIFDALLAIDATDEVTIVAGQQVVPLGLELTQAPTATLFVERSLPSTLVPNRDVGLTVNYRTPSGTVGVNAGLFNGAPDNSNAAPLVDEALDTVLRVWTRPLAGSDGALSSLQIGVGGMWTPGNDDLGGRPLASGYPTTGRFVMTRPGADVSGARGAAYRGTANLWWAHERTRVLAEGTVSSNRYTNGSEEAELANVASHFGIGYAIGGTAAWGGVIPDRPLPSGPGAFEIKARVASIHFGEDTEGTILAPGSVDSAVEVGTGVSWWATRTARWMVDVHHTTFSAANDVPAETVFISTVQIGL